MPYINPLRLLHISSVEPALVRKAKNQQLALLQLSDEGTLDYGGVQVDRSTFLLVCDQLKDQQLSQFHLTLFAEERLLEFLSFGQTRYFEDYHPHSMWDEPAFRRFVGPFYSEQFDRVYAQAFTSRDVYLLRKMLEPEPLLPPGQDDSLFRQTHRRAEEERNRLREYQQRISYSASSTEDTTAAAFYRDMQTISSLETWQALPDAFTSVRSDIAVIFSRLALRMQHQFGLNQAELEELLQKLGQLKVNAWVRRDLEQQHQGFFERRKELEKEQKRQQRARAEAFLRKIDELLTLFQEARISTEILMAGVSELFTDSALTPVLPHFKAEEKERLSNKLRTLSVLLWEKEENPAPIYFLLYASARLELKEKKPFSLLPPVYAHTPTNSVEASVTGGVLILETLRALAQKNQRFRHGKNHLSSWARLLEMLLHDQAQEWLLRKGSYELQAWVYNQLFPLLHLFRRVDPETTLRLVVSLHALLHDDNVVAQKTDQLRQDIENDLREKRGEKVKRRAPKVEPEKPFSYRQLSEASFWQQLLHQDRFEGMRLIRLFGMVAGTAFFTLLSIYFMSFLVQEQQHAVEVKNTSSIMQQTYDEYDFIVQKSDYRGNQLPTRSVAFPNCFGEGTNGGGGFLVVSNQTAEDMVACLYFPDSMIVRHAYIRQGQQMGFRDLPQDSMRMKVYLGHDWNPLKPNFCGTDGAFDTQPQYFRLMRHIVPGRQSTNRLVIQGQTSVELPNGSTEVYSKVLRPISARSFFFVKSDWKRRRDGEL